MDYYKRALEINEALEKKTNIAGITQNIGLLYIKSEHFDAAIDYIRKSMKIYEELNEDESIGISLSNIGLIYQKQQKYQHGHII